MRFFITGAGGYIGSHVVTKLLDNGHQVVAVDFNTDRIDSRAEIRNYNVFEDSPQRQEDITQCDVCLHMAWQDGFVHNSERHITNLPLHFEFMKSLTEGGIKQIAVMGSMHEIGYYEGCVDENTTPNPLSYYGIAKNTLRQIIELLCRNTSVTWQWLRCYYLYGDDEHNNSVFSKILQMEKEGRDKFSFNSGKNQYDFLHIELLAAQIAAAVSQSEVSGIINCCSGVPVALKDKVEEFIKERGLKIRPAYGEYPDRPYDSPAIWGDNRKICRIMAQKAAKA